MKKTVPAFLKSIVIFAGGAMALLALPSAQADNVYWSDEGTQTVAIQTLPDAGTWAKVVGGVGMMLFVQRIRRRMCAK